jgi:hypothetical protein
MYDDEVAAAVARSDRLVQRRHTREAVTIITLPAVATSCGAAAGY